MEEKQIAEKRKKPKESASEMLYNVLKEILETQALILKRQEAILQANNFLVGQLGLDKSIVERRAQEWKKM